MPLAKTPRSAQTDSSPEMSQNHLVDAVANDDPMPPTQTNFNQAPEVLERLIDQELPTLYRVALRFTASQEEAEDLVGQTLAKATKGWGQFDGTYPRSWLIKILKNEFLESVRRAKARPRTVEIDEAHWDSLPDGPLSVDRLEVSEVLAAVDRLPEDYRVAIALFDVEQLTYDEIALATGVPVGTVRSRLFRARRMLRRALPAYAEP